jgi:glycerol-3-phosphate O-acyltransferase
MFTKIFDGINYRIEDIKKIREVAHKGPLILVPSHKSHMDYLIISSIFFQNKLAPPHIVAGSNLTFFPMGPVFRKSGAFFMRRSFKNLDLYPEIFKQYIKTLICEGYSIEFFIEGGRTRTGKLVFPKMGILKYLIESIEEGYNRDMIFVPITINYDRILEESSYQKELKGKEKKSESTSGFVKSRKLLKRKYGKVYLSFNEPFSFREYCDNLTEGEDVMKELSYYLVRRINEITMVTPFAITAAAILLSSIKGFSREMLKDTVLKLADYLRFGNARISETLSADSNIDEIIDYVIESYEEDNIVSELEKESEADKGEISLTGHYVLDEEDRARINFYKNNIIHYFLPIAYVSIILLKLSGAKGIKEEDIARDFGELFKLFYDEFIYNEEMFQHDSIVKKTLGYLEEKGIVIRKEGTVAISSEKRGDLLLFARMFQDVLESYYIVLDSVTQIMKRMNSKDLTHEIRKNGIKLYHLGQIKLSESLSMPNYRNSLEKWEKEEILNSIKVSKKNIEMEVIEPSRAEEFKKVIGDYLKVLY